MPHAVDRAATADAAATVYDDDHDEHERTTSAEGRATLAHGATEPEEERATELALRTTKRSADPEISILNTAEVPLCEGRVLADRYRLLAPLGEGAHGEVWAAEDLILCEPLALKWIRASGGASMARIRREITTLRMLHVPGVVRLRDDGIEDGRAFLVMDRVDGRPFPGLPAPSSGAALAWPWSAIEETTVTLLEILARVHAAGIVHRDLKPDNVLVDASGRPTLLDFGISLLREPTGDRRASASSIVGTPRYLAPEQILGGAVDGRADLYAVGVMVFEALTGRFPHEAPDVRSLLSARLYQPAPRARELAPELPDHVGVVVDRLLSTVPEARFRSAREVIAALGGDLRSPSSARGGALSLRSLRSAHVPRDEAALRSLFAGPDRLFHLREDAARLLWERTAGEPASVETELASWTRLGLARWDDGALVVDRASLRLLGAAPLRAAPLSSRAALLDAGVPLEGLATMTTAEHEAIAALLQPGDEGKLFHLLSADRLLEAAQESVELSRRRAREGDLAGATAALREGLRAARGLDGDGEACAVEDRILSEWAKVALTEATPYALDQALYQIARARDRRPLLERLDTLLRSTLSAPGAGGLRALESVDAALPFEDPELERRRHLVRIAAVAARSSSTLLEEVLDDVAAWAERSGEPLAFLCLAEGRARLRYGQGRFEEAAALNAEAARSDPWLTGRIAATLNVASSLLEAFRHREAAERAAEARDLAARSRHPYREGRAEWLLRAAKYRMGEAGPPDLELVDAVTRVGVPDLEALVCLTEAAVAFREGSLAAARELADRAASTWKALNRPGGPLLARALALTCGAPAEGGEVDELAKRAAGCKIPGIGIQALGLLGRARPDARPSWQASIAELAATIPKEHWGGRMDVLSVEEALASVTLGSSRA